MQTNNNNTEKAIIDVMNSDVRFKRFSEFLKTAGLEEKLRTEKDLTVFAPTNEAFAGLTHEKTVEMLKPENREQLRKRMLLHVVPKSLDIAEITKADSLKTESGAEIKVDISKDQKQIRLLNATVVLPREEALNGVLYPLDAILERGKATVATA